MKRPELTAPECPPASLLNTLVTIALVVAVVAVKRGRMVNRVFGEPYFGAIVRVGVPRAIILLSSAPIFAAVLGAVFVYAFFRFTWSIRQYSMGALLVAAAPGACSGGYHLPSLAFHHPPCGVSLIHAPFVNLTSVAFPSLVQEAAVPTMNCASVRALHTSVPLPGVPVTATGPEFSAKFPTCAVSMRCAPQSVSEPPEKSRTCRQA